MKSLAVIVTTITFGLIFTSCSEPNNPPNNMPDTTSHDFIWTVDTLNTLESNQIVINKLDGFSENEVWAAGHCSDSRYAIWLWNGDEWKTRFPGFFESAPSFFDLIIDNDSNIWFVGKGATFGSGNTLIHNDFILKHQNNEWIKLPEFNLKYCKSIAQDKEGFISIACDSGVVLNNYINEFQKEFVGEIVQSIDLWTGENKYLLMTAIIENTDTYLLLSRNENSWLIKEKIDLRQDAILNWRFGRILWGPDTLNLYSAGPAGIYKYENSHWQEVIYNKNFQQIYGSDLNNIFAGTVYGEIFHYNGMSWKKDIEISDILNNGVRSIWCNKEYVFIATSDGYNTFIARGERK